MAVLGISFIATALNSLASTAFTREGQHLSLIKFIPVPYDIQMYAKAFLSFIFTYPAILLTDIIICLYMKAPFYIGVFYAIIMFLAHVLSIIIGMMMDSSSPYVEWDDEYSALRGNLNTFFNMAIMMLLSIIFIVLGLLLYELLKLPILVYYLVVLVSLTIITVRMFIVGKRQILINMERL